MASAPAISVLMPVYNAERYVAQAVESILHQTFEDFEFLIVDDGSTDRSLQILRRYEKQDTRIRLISRHNSGYVVALNEMLKLARGEFIARMDADDISCLDRFAKQLRYLHEHSKCVVVGSMMVLIDREGWKLEAWRRPTTHEQIDHEHLRSAEGCIPHPGVMMSRHALETVGGYNAALEPAEDLDLWLRLAEVGRLANLPEQLLRYRVHPDSVSYVRSAQQHLSAWAAVRNAYTRRGLGNLPEIPAYAPREIQPTHPISTARKALADGYGRTAVHYSVQQLRQRPLEFGAWKVLLRSVARVCTAAE